MTWIDPYSSHLLRSACKSRPSQETIFNTEVLPFDVAKSSHCSSELVELSRAGFACLPLQHTNSIGFLGFLRVDNCRSNGKHGGDCSHNRPPRRLLRSGPEGRYPRIERNYIADRRPTPRN